MSIDDLLPDEPNQDDVPIQLFAGVVLDNAASETAEVRVRLKIDDETHQVVGPMAFMPRVKPGGSGLVMVLPQKGDRCLVAFDEDQRPWMAVWRYY